MGGETFEELAVRVWSEVGDLTATATSPKRLHVDFGDAWSKTLEDGFEATRHGREWERELWLAFTMRGPWECRRMRIFHTGDGRAGGALVAVSVFEPLVLDRDRCHRSRVDVIDWTEAIREWSRRVPTGRAGRIPETPTGCSVIMRTKPEATIGDVAEGIARLESMIPKAARDLLVLETFGALEFPDRRKAA